MSNEVWYLQSGAKTAEDAKSRVIQSRKEDVIVKPKGIVEKRRKQSKDVKKKSNNQRKKGRTKRNK